MVTNKTEIRALERLQSESELMFSLRRDGRIEVEGVGGKPYRIYKVTVHAKTYVKTTDGATPRLSDGPHIFLIEAKVNYPLKSAPIVNFISDPPAHINVFEGGQVCIGKWNPRETLASETDRILRVLFIDSKTFNIKSPADSKLEDFSKSFEGRAPMNVEAGFKIPCPVFLDEDNAN